EEQIMRCSLPGFICQCAIVALLSQGAWGQGLKTSSANDSPALKEAKKLAPNRTVVEIELLQTDNGGTLYAHQWQKILLPMELGDFKVRHPTQGEKPELKERQSGLTRYVTAIGILDRTGQISFPDRTFTTSDTAKLKEWINELKTYGVLGTPSG